MYCIYRTCSAGVVPGIKHHGPAGEEDGLDKHGLCQIVPLMAMHRQYVLIYVGGNFDVLSWFSAVCTIYVIDTLT